MGIRPHVRTLIIRFVVAQSRDSVSNGYDSTVGDLVSETGSRLWVVFTEKQPPCFGMDSIAGNDCPHTQPFISFTVISPLPTSTRTVSDAGK